MPRYGNARAMSRMVMEYRDQMLWYAEGDNRPYYVTDGEGCEIESFANVEEACWYLRVNGWEL